MTCSRLSVAERVFAADNLVPASICVFVVPIDVRVCAGVLLLEHSGEPLAVATWCLLGVHANM